MKQYFGLALGLLAGTMIGAAAVTGLHAQAKPPVYLITEIDVTNPEAYAKRVRPAGSEDRASGWRSLCSDRRNGGSWSETDHTIRRNPAKAGYRSGLGQHGSIKQVVQ